jgi:hypothetical protein
MPSPEESHYVPESKDKGRNNLYSSMKGDTDDSYKPGGITTEPLKQYYSFQSDNLNRRTIFS